jgi:TRAP transporter 4TM/12TM fusion protein
MRTGPAGPASSTTDRRVPPVTLFGWLATAIVVYHIVIVGSLAAWAGFFMPDQVHGAISLAAALTVIFLLIPASGQQHGAGRDPQAGPRRPTLFDLALILCALVSLGYVVFFHDEVLNYSMYGFLDGKGIVLALLLCAPLIEAVRRTTGLTLPIMVGFLVLATLFQNYLPGVLYGRGYDADRLLYSSYVGESGIFGLPLNVATNIIIVFVLFGACMEVSGAGKWFLQLALSLTGSSRGGPAKAAVVSSALFGSISGSPSANVATTGVFTIPLMKQIGYRPAFAGAVEAVASTGGQILPPVMGAIAFVMAEWIRVPYAQIAIAAFVPASLYFLIVFVSVHLQAHREGVQALPRAELPRLGQVLREGWFYLIPIAALIYLLIVKAYPPGMAAILSIPFVFGASFLSKDRAHWLTPRNFVTACTRTVRGWITVAAITGFVGIMIGAIELSGIGVKISTFILDLSGGNLVLTLLLVGLASFVLGMGLDAIPVYVTLATLMAPALVQLGVSDMAAHLFVIYWGLASFYTPPLCIAVFVAISLSGGKLWETGGEAVRLGIAAFVIPFAFVLDESLLLRGSTGQIVWAIFTAVVGATLLACGIRGYALTPLDPVRRVLVGAGGLAMIGPGIYPPLAGALVAAIAIVPWPAVLRMRWRRAN